MKNEFVLAFNEVIEEKQLPREIIMEAITAAMVSAYRKAVSASSAQHVDATIDPETGRVSISAEKEVVDIVQDERTEVSLEDALKVNPHAKINDMVVVESTPKNFGRIAAQTARQVIQQRIREAERGSQLDHYSRQLGEIVSGGVSAIGPQGITLGLDMKAEGVMPRSQQIPNERFRLHDRVRALLIEVKPTPRGPQIIVSRGHRNFLRRLLENEVPEIYHGMVEIRSIAREPGQRSKVAVSALQPAVDPVGACVGIRGVRIQAIVRELNDEKIDVIEWSSDPVVYIAKALSPARVSGVYLNEQAKGAKTATVVVPEDQLSLAIGRDGQNARLAAKLTSWRIDIKSLPEAAADALHKLQVDQQFAELAASEAEIIPQVEFILGKKTEGRPVTPEEYQVLTQFVDRIERGAIRKREAERQIEDERVMTARAQIPAFAFAIPLEEFEVTDRVYTVISESGFQTVGDLMLQMKLDPDSILKLSGMGPKTMKELETALEAIYQKAEAEKSAEAAKGGLEPELSEQIEPSISMEGPGEQPETEKVPELELAPQIELTPEPEALAEEKPQEEAPAPEAETLKAEVEKAEAPEVELIPTPTGDELEAGESLEDLFVLPPDVIDIREIEDEGEEEEDGDKKKKKKKKKKFVELEYDPEKDFLLAKKKRKRGGADWDEEWSG